MTGEFEVLHPGREIWLKPEKFVISFHGESGKDLGKLEEGDDGTLAFSGKANPSAEVFFKSVVVLNLKMLNEAKTLLKVAKCPNEGCGGQGWSAHQVGEDVWEQEQCQFCAERKELLGE